MRKNILAILCCFMVSCTFAQDYDLSDGLYFDGEPYLAIDPHNAEHIIVAWIGFTPGYQTGIKVKVSWDGGNSWSASTFLPHISSITHSADPSLQFDTAGYLYACYIDFHQVPDSGYVCICRSPDGGLTWGSPHKVIGAYADGLKMPIDRPWFSINPTNDHFYVTTKPAPWILPPNRPYFSVSTDTGATWSWRYLDTASYLTGPDIAAPMPAPAVGSDGVLRIVYPSYVPSQNLLPGYLLASSTSDGATFSYQPVVYSSTSIPSSDSLAKVGYHLSIDPTNPNHLLFDFLGNKYGDLDVFTIESTNGGASWSSPIRVNDDSTGNGKMQDMPWASFDLNGDIIAGWRDRRDAPGTGYQQPAQIWGAIKRADSATYSPNFKISDTLAPFNATYLDTSGNDFMCVAMHNDTMYSVWGDVRTGALNIWFVRRAMDSSSVTDIRLLTDEAVAAVYAYPQPASDRLYFKGATVTNVSITDLRGQTVLSQAVKEQSLDITSLPQGAYIIQLRTAAGSATQRFIKE